MSACTSEPVRSPKRPMNRLTGIRLLLGRLLGESLWQEGVGEDPVAGAAMQSDGRENDGRTLGQAVAGNGHVSVQLPGAEMHTLGS